jgi:hypothetical protein
VTAATASVLARRAPCRRPVTSSQTPIPSSGAMITMSVSTAHTTSTPNSAPRTSVGRSEISHASSVSAMSIVE